MNYQSNLVMLVFIFLGGLSAIYYSYQGIYSLLQYAKNHNWLNKILLSLTGIKSYTGRFFIGLTCVLIVIYFGMKIYQEIRPKSIKEQQLKCLELGSDYARKTCLVLIKK